MDIYSELKNNFPEMKTADIMATMEIIYQAVNAWDYCSEDFAESLLKSAGNYIPGTPNHSGYWFAKKLFYMVQWGS